MLLGDPASPEVTRRSVDEGIGKATIAAKVRNALSFYRPLDSIPGIEIRCHGTTLYNSIYRFDAEVRSTEPHPCHRHSVHPMTPATTEDPTTLRHILARTTALLLDFDGPICSVFAGLAAHTVVTQLCLVLADGGHGDPPIEIEKSDDPFEVLAYAAGLGDDEARYVNAAFTAHEVEAIATAEPTPGGHDLIRAWSATGRPLVIVSNNSTIAIHAYLDLHDLRTHVTRVSARTSPDPALLKPHPHLLTTALTALNIAPAAATFVGDSVTDIQAARAAGTMSIGYADKPRKRTELITAGADTVISTPTILTEQIT